MEGIDVPLRDTDLHPNPTLGSAAGSGSKMGERAGFVWFAKVLTTAKSVVGRDACQVSFLQGYGGDLGMLNCLIREERSEIDTY
jgi:hypothetical protein